MYPTLFLVIAAGASKSAPRHPRGRFFFFFCCAFGAVMVGEVQEQGGTAVLAIDFRPVIWVLNLHFARCVLIGVRIAGWYNAIVL